MKKHITLRFAVIAAICVFSCVAAEVMPAQTAAAQPDAAADALLPKGYTQLVEKGSLVLAADTDTGLFCLANRETGDVFHSVPEDIDTDPYTKALVKNSLRSQIAVTYISSENEVESAREDEANSFSDCVSSGGIEFKSLKDGFRVTYHFQNQKIKIPVEYVLSEQYLTARIVASEIEQGEEYILTSISLLPSFGAGNWLSDGYIFVPDGSGALINYNNSSRDIYEKPVYGTEKAALLEQDRDVGEDIRLPVFGLSSGRRALFGIITKGAESAAIKAASGNQELGYNMVHSRLILRENYQKNMFNGQQLINRLTPKNTKLKAYEVRYYPLSGEDCGYSKMAQVYRDYLEQEAGLKQNVQPPALNLDVYGSIDVKANFLGFIYRKNIPLTTFGQAKEILSRLNQSDIEKIDLRYFGWGGSGIANKKILKKASLLGILGGRKAFDELEKWTAENGGRIYLESDLLSYRKGSRENAIKTVYNETALQYTFLRSVYHRARGIAPYMYVTPGRISGYAEKFLSSFTKQELPALSLASVANTCYADLGRRTFTPRSEMISACTSVLDSAVKHGLPVAGDSANAYAVPYLSKIFAAPVFSSGESIFDAEVPFYQMVFHGYTSMTAPDQIGAADRELQFLKAVESGSELLWKCMYADSAIVADTDYNNLYSSTYSLWTGDALEKYQAYYPLLRKIYNQKIVAHRILAKGVTQTRYENGVLVTVNFTDTAYGTDTITPPRSFTVREGQ